MTKHQKDKQARKNAEKDEKRRKITVEEVELVLSDIRRQEAEINKKLDEREKEIESKWGEWCEWFCHYSVPRICVGFYYATLQASKVYLIKSAREEFMDRISVEMQKVLDHMYDGDDVDLDKFQYYADLLEEEGYAVPVWAQKGDLEKKWEEENERS